MAEARANIYSFYRCRACDNAWRIEPAAGARVCPKCGSKRVDESPAPGGAVEYATTDRSHGYALEDIRLGKLAQWAGLITGNQYSDALNQQRQHVGRGRRIPPLGEILTNGGALKKRQVDALLALRVTAWKDSSEQEFEALALEKGLLTPERMREAKAAQCALLEKGETPPPLALMLYEKHLLVEKELEALLQAQARRGAGLIALTAMACAEETGAAKVERLIGAKGSMQRKLRVAAAVLTPFILLFMLLGVFGGHELTALTRCNSCARMVYYPLDSQWPLKCDNCGKKAVYPRGICLRCARQFTVEDPSARGVRCPHCGFDRYQLLTNEVDETKLRERILASDVNKANNVPGKAPASPPKTK